MMTTNILRGIGLFFIITLASFAGLAQASPHDLYVGTWKGEITIGRAVPVQFTFERAGNVLKGFVIDPSGERKPLSQVNGSESGTVFRMERDETTAMVFTGKLSADKASLSGDVTIMEGKVARGKAPWTAKKVAATAASVSAIGTPDTYLKNATEFRDKAVEMQMSGVVMDTEEASKAGALALMSKALADVNKFIAAKPQDHRGYLKRGSLHYDLWNVFSDGSRLKDGVLDLDKAIALSPENAELFYTRSLIHGALGDDAKSAADLAKYHSLSKR